MQWAELAVSFVEAVAWPLSVVVVVVLLRHKLFEWFRGDPPQRMKAGPVEIEWQRASTAIEGSVDQQETSGNVPQLYGPVSSHYTSLLDSSPAGVVLDAYNMVENLIRDRAIPARPEAPDGVPIAYADEALKKASGVRLARLAHQRGGISSESLRAFEAISVLRNLVAHGGAPEVTREQGEEFLSMTDAVYFAVDTWRHP